MIGSCTWTQFKALPARFRIPKPCHRIDLPSFRSMSVQQPPWSLPEKQTEEPVLRVYNSLTRTKVESTSYSSDSSVSHRHTEWICSAEWAPCKMVQLRSYGLRCVAYGPCQVSHIPIAGRLRQLTVHRNYVTQDILRRIMTDYFGYDVHFVMNVTDIDDKVGSMFYMQRTANVPSTDHRTRSSKSPFWTI